MPTSAKSRPARAAAIRGVDARRASEFVSFAETRRRRKRNQARTADLRPLAEPPMLDWEEFRRAHLVSDLRYKALFPDDAGKRSRMKDLDGEYGALIGYKAWAKCSIEDEGSERRDFFMHLLEDITEDGEEIEKEVGDLWSQASGLNQFEYQHLDDDGGTTGIEHCMGEGIDIFRGWEMEARGKYGYLTRESFNPDPLKTFEFVFLDVMGSTEALERSLGKGDDVFKEWPEEAVRRKYGHLVKLMPRLPEGAVEEKRRTNRSVLTSCQTPPWRRRKGRIPSDVLKTGADEWRNPPVSQRRFRRIAHQFVPIYQVGSPHQRQSGV